MSNNKIKEFIIYLTFNCNFSCKMCTQDTVLPKNNLSVDDWDKIFWHIEQNYPNSTLIFLGGEPTVYPEFEKIIEKVSCKKLHKHIVTNGYNLDKYLPVLIKNHCGITLSIDGLEATHDKIRNKKGSFKKAIALLQKMASINKSIKRHKSNLFFMEKMVLFLRKTHLPFTNVLKNKIKKEIVKNGSSLSNYKKI